MSEIKEIINDILESKVSKETKSSLIENLGDVKKELKEIQIESEYNRIMSKPLMTGYDIINFPSEPNDYLIENFLWKGSIGMVIGAEKACKSIFTSQKAMAMTTGKDFLGCFDVARPLKVLYVQAEGDMGETKERFISATSKGGLVWEPNNWRHFYPPALCLDIDGEIDRYGKYPDGTYNDFVQRIEEDGFEPDVIIIDPLYMAMDGDLIDNKASRHFCRNIRKLKERFGCAVIVVHHEHRAKTDKNNLKIEEGDNAIFGSSMWKNFASHVLRISITNERGNPISSEKEEEQPFKFRKVSCATQRNGNVVKKIMLRLCEKPLMFHVVDAKPSGTTERNVLNYLETHGPVCAYDVSKGAGMNTNTVSSSFRRLAEKGLIKQHSKDGHKVLYELVRKEI
jgi:RecA-family ATPase